MEQVEDFYLNKAPLPPHPVAVTLDDGFADNYLNALPILRKFQVPACIFMASGYIGRKNDWMIGRGGPLRDMLSWEQAAEMRNNGISIGAHTVNHPRLDEVSLATASQEIIGSKLELEQRLGEAIRWFASTSTRNFDDRIGDGAKVFLGSAELGAIIASLGRIPTKEEYFAAIKEKVEPKKDAIYKYLQFDEMPEYAGA